MLKSIQRAAAFIITHHLLLKQTLHADEPVASICRKMWGRGQSGQAIKLFQAPQKINFTFHFSTQVCIYFPLLELPTLFSALEADAAMRYRNLRLTLTLLFL